MTNESKIWSFLKSKGLNDFGVAGLMGNLYAESGLNPKNLQNTHEKKLSYTDESYTAAVDNGKYNNFVFDSAGYGLAQWTYWSRKQALLKYVKAAKTSIGDLDAQLDFLYKELSENYTAVLKILKNATSVQEASDAVLTKYERPANQGASVKEKRAGYGLGYYNKYAAGAASTINKGGNTMRQKIVNMAVSFLGCNEADGSHKKIIDIYNSHKPLARSYKVKYTDAWCATFASAMAIKCGMTDIIPTECGCGQMIALFQKLGAWQENDAYKPQAGDYIFYDWDDSGAGNNTGWPEHVGIVVSVSGSTIKVIEGNISNKVGYRNIAVNARYIRGYGVPKYKEQAVAPEVKENDDEKLAYKVGDVVNFTGKTHYTSSYAGGKAKSCKPGKAKVTQLSPGKPHPYCLKAVAGGGSTVHGWTDAADISGAAASGGAIAVGKTVKVKSTAKKYATGQTIPSWVKTKKYTVQKISGERALLKEITSWVNLSDLELA